MDYRLKIPEGWINIGDANPERHGGIFLQWDNGMWHIIETTHFADIPDGVSENEHMFQSMRMEPSDIFKNPGDITEGFTDWATNQLITFSRQPFEIESVNDPSLIPEGESFSDHCDWILENHANWIVTSCAFSFVGYYGGHETDFAEDYWGYLSDYGIDPDNF